MYSQKSRSYLWYLLPVVFGAIGGIIAYFILRKDDPLKAKTCLLVGFGISAAYFVYIFATYDSPDEEPIITEEPVNRESTSGSIEFSKPAYSVPKETPQISKSIPTSIDEMKQLPDSCKGVNSMELELYPTGKQCFAALNDRVEQWCLSQSNGNDSLAKGCVTEFYLRLTELCEDPVIGSVEVCLMYNFKDLYSKLIP